MAKRNKNKIIRVGIVGAGPIGWKRAKAITAVPGGTLAAVADVDFRRAKKLADAYRCEAMDSSQSLVKRGDLDVVVVAVPTKFVKPIAISALKQGKHIFSEKPFGRSAKESSDILRAAKRYRRLVKVGFNHRFQPAIVKAKKLYDAGAIGKILFIRARYGHGGRLGMEKEWRFQKNISGGGELLDQGVHVIDLARWFAGNFKKVYGLARTKFWKTKLDDNTFALLENERVTASFHVSTTNWKNIFSFEVFGTKGFLVIDGKGGSYGKETLTFGKRKLTFGVPKIKTFEFQEDSSWKDEWRNFVSALRGKSKIIGDGVDGLQVNRIVEAIYKSSRKGRPIVVTH